MVQTDAEESRLEKGCLRYDVLEDADKPTCFSLYKVFKNKNAVEEHDNTKHQQAMKDFEEMGGFEEKEEQTFKGIYFTH